MKFFAAGVVSLMVSLAFAEETVDPIKFIGTATSRSSSRANESDITNPEKWGDGMSQISADADYLVDSGKYCGFGGGRDFPGKSLTLGVAGGTAGNLQSFSTGECGFGVLILERGEIYSALAPSAPTKIKADSITVNALESSPFAIVSSGGYKSHIEFYAPFYGNGHIRLQKTKQSSDTMRMWFKDSLENFKGTIEIGNPTAAAAANYRTVVLVGHTHMSGKIVLNPCGAIAACGVDSEDYMGEFSTEILSFSEGSTIRLGVNATTGGTIRVTKELSLPSSGKVTIDVMALPDNSLGGRRHPVLIAPAGSGMQESDFELKVIGNASGELHGKLKDCSLGVETVDGNDILYIDLGNYTVYKGSGDGWNDSSFMPEYSSRWSGVPSNTLIDENTTYVSYSREIVTPGVEYEFPGKSLVLCGRDLLFACRKLTVNDFHVMNAAELRFWSQNSIDLYGKITLSNPASGGTALELLQSKGYKAEVHSDISGSGNIKIIGALKNGNERPSSGTVILSGVNTAFTGRILLANECGSVGTNITLRVSDIRALGGPMSAFAYNAYSFQEWSRFQADANLAIVDPTRGVYFEGNAYVKIPNASHTLTLATQTTMAGTLVKEGAGTLALGGVLKFTKNQNDEPLEGTNILRVAEGCIKPASKSGADGLAIAFAAGTALALSPLAETDADVAQFGLYNEKWTEPFDLTDSDGKLEVKLDLPEDLPISFSFGVCTVSASAAESLRGKIELPKVSRYSCSISESSIENGTVTFTATYTRPAFTISIR